MNKSFFILDKKTNFYIIGLDTKPLNYALGFLFRDIENILGTTPQTTDIINEADIIIKKTNLDTSNYQEYFEIKFDTKKDLVSNTITISGSDELGIIYGILHFSTKYLNIDPFWFWTDLIPTKTNTIDIEINNYISPIPKVRYRGWFVNDEVCLIGWTNKYPPPKEVWLPVFETLLRCGGNMVIPGTDLPRTGIQLDLAKDMGLYITHHHAEPLGAEMFARAYPNLEAQYSKYNDLYESLWIDSITKQNYNKVIWTLGFRGQGDCPFWEHDKSYTTPQSRGQLISNVIRRQYDILHEYLDSPICSTYLYGEIMELYKEGHIHLPNDVITIWSDNGYGKMVSRRQGNHNPRIPSLPENPDHHKHGLYYHITFHDLQASNHLTMFPNNPILIKNELEEAFIQGANTYILLNCGNIRPHIYALDIIRTLWKNGHIDIHRHLDSFISRFISSENKLVCDCYNDYFNAIIKYGQNNDDMAGDEFYHHPVRSIIGHWICGKIAKPAEDLNWAANNITFTDQIKTFYNMLVSNVVKWDKLYKKSLSLNKQLKENEQLFFENHLIFHVKIHLIGCKGFINICESYFSFIKQDYMYAFLSASKSLWNYQKCSNVLKNSEYGKWKNFYRGDWLTNIKSTIYSIDSLRKFIRIHGDSPDFFLWYRKYLMPDTEKNIYLENTHRKPFSDDELAKMLINDYDN